MAVGSFKLGDDFPPVPLENWLRAVEKDLKGAPFEKKLVTPNHEGLPVRPLYGRRDWDAAGDPSGFPGQAPFTRGAGLLGNVAGWDLRQEYVDPDPGSVSAAVHEDLRGGTTSILIRLDRAARAGLDPDAPAAAGLAGRDGVMAATADDLAACLEGVDLRTTPVALLPGASFLPAAVQLADVWARWEAPPAEVRGAFNADPLGTLAAGGALRCSLDESLLRLGDLAAWTRARYRRVTSVLVDTSPYHDAGADSVLEIAAALATGLAYLKALTARGLDLDAAAGQIVFSFSAGCEFFAEIAKLRAARRAWARLVQASGGGSEAQAMRMHVRTSRRVLTARDPWVNILRATAGAFAAGLGGADSVTVSPFDAALGLPDAFSRRIARNVQVILQEESHLNRVIDPAGGCWHLEKRTDELALAGWTLFQEIEDRCGMEKALRHGWVAERIAEVAEARRRDVARRKAPITGVSEFPNLDEEIPARGAPDRDALRRAAGDALAARRGRPQVKAALRACAAIDDEAEPGSFCVAASRAVAEGASLGMIGGSLPTCGEAAVMTPLPARRLAEDFERLRDAADAHRTATGARPRLFLANLGPVAQHTARLGWSRNFLAAGGIAAEAGGGFADPAAAAAAFAASGATAALICSSDAVYAESGPETARLLKEAGARSVTVAGRPGDLEAAWSEAGADRFIHIGCDVLAILGELLQEQGVSA